jgi:hypothetical protein
MLMEVPGKTPMETMSSARAAPKTMLALKPKAKLHRSFMYRMFSLVVFPQALNWLEARSVRYTPGAVGSSDIGIRTG